MVCWYLGLWEIVFCAGRSDFVRFLQPLPVDFFLLKKCTRFVIINGLRIRSAEGIMQKVEIMSCIDTHVVSQVRYN